MGRVMIRAEKARIGKVYDGRTQMDKLERIAQFPLEYETSQGRSRTNLPSFRLLPAGLGI